VEAIARAIMSRLLHEPTIRLRSHGERGHANIELVRELFGLSDDEPDARASAAADMDEAPDNVRQLSRPARAGGSGSS
jgi:glutamyl-tRNA reductase